MDASEPRARHRGYFLNSPDSPDADPGEEAAAEGVTIRVRIIRPRLKRRAAGVMRRSVLRPSRPSDRQPAARRHTP
jgi:hypothetical protein